MGNQNSYISEISDESTDSEFDYSIEPRTAKFQDATFSAYPGILESNMDNENTVTESPQNKLTDVNRSTQQDVTTDAAIKVSHFPNAETVLTLEKVLEIEKNLETYEMVSMVYLLYDGTYTNLALQELIMLLKGAQKTPLYSWANLQESQSRKWQKQLIEALCVIKNYQILKKLGYKKEDLVAHYLPHRVNALTSLNKARKGMYLVCEKLDEKKTSIFIEHVKRQFQEKNMVFDEFNPEFLELYFLKWEILSFISPRDLDNIKSALKVMNEEHLCDILTDCVSKESNEGKETKATIPIRSSAPQPDKPTKLPKTRNPSTSKDSHLLEGYVEYQPAFYSYGVDNIPKNSDVDDESNRYKIDPENPGVLLIINQEVFYTEIEEEFKSLLPEDIDKNKLESRTGTEKDRDDLEKIFKKFGFKVIVKDNLMHEDMVEQIKEVVRTIRDESSLFVCIMSHGDKGVVYGANSCKVKVSKIQEILCRVNKENLAGKPKILILQSCQGKQCEKMHEHSEKEDEDDYSITTDGPGSSKQSVPRKADMLTLWATVPGYAAIRNKRTGSWFIQALCNKMEQLGNKYHFLDIFTRIVSDVTDRRWTLEHNGEYAMTPVIVSTLRKDFYLPPMRDT